jgi:hypothetical protein
VLRATGHGLTSGEPGEQPGSDGEFRQEEENNAVEEEQEEGGKRIVGVSLSDMPEMQDAGAEWCVADEISDFSGHIGVNDRPEGPATVRDSEERGDGKCDETGNKVEDQKMTAERKPPVWCGGS